MRLHSLTNALLFAGALATLGFMIYAAQGVAGLFAEGGWLFTIWALLPFLLLSIALRTSKHPKVQILILVVAVVVIARGSFAYYHSFLAHPDAQSALVFLFTPLEQNIASAFALIVSVANNIKSNEKAA